MLRKTGQRVLKAIHIASAGVWLGGLVAIVLLLVMLPHAGSRGRFGLALAAHAIHDGVLFWAFAVTLLTGLGFATLTSWGTIRHHWITLKWLLAVALFVTTLWFQNPALAILAGLSDANADAIGGLDYEDAYRTAVTLAVAQLGIVVVVFAISSLKPWGQRARDIPRKVVIGVAVVGLSIGGAFGVFNHVRLEHIRQLPIDEVAVTSRTDGTWHGSVDDCGAPYEVEVTLVHARITRIVATRTGDNRYSRLGAAVLPRIVDAQSPAVDAITGATTTSRCLSRAVGVALRDAPIR